MKTYLIMGFIGLGLSTQSAFAFDIHDRDMGISSVQKNICDRLIEENRASEQAINNCLKKNGKSEYRKDLERRLKIEEDDANSERQNVARLRDLLEKRTFSEQELNDKFFEQTIVMTKADRNDPTDVDYVFNANYVCKYLGYARASKVVVPDMHGEIWADQATDSNWITLNSSLQMKDYDPFFNNHLVKPLKEITCHRTIDGSKEALKLLPDSAKLKTSGEKEARNPRDDDRRIDDSSRNYQPRKPKYDRYNDFTSGLGSSNSR
jgi:hypothetical protein